MLELKPSQVLETHLMYSTKCLYGIHKFGTAAYISFIHLFPLVAFCGTASLPLMICTIASVIPVLSADWRSQIQRIAITISRLCVRFRVFVSVPLYRTVFNAHASYVAHICT